MYDYAATVMRVIDGDTVVLSLDLGFRISVQHTVRLADINAPEHGTPAGDEATEFLTQLLLPGKKVRASTSKPDPSDKYGRWLATLTVATAAESEVNVNDLMVKTGHAEPYSGRGPRP